MLRQGQRALAFPTACLSLQRLRLLEYAFYVAHLVHDADPATQLNHGRLILGDKTLDHLQSWACMLRSNGPSNHVYRLTCSTKRSAPG